MNKYKPCTTIIRQFHKFLKYTTTFILQKFKLYYVIAYNFINK